MFGFEGIFNATIGVFWVILFIPWAIREQRYKLFGLVGAVMLTAEVTLSMHFANREWPYNFLAGVSIFCIGLLIGYFIYRFEGRQRKDD